MSNIIKSSRLVEVEPVNYISKDVSIDNKELEKIFEDTIKRAKEEHELIISDAKDESKKIIEKAEIKYEEMINTAYSRAKEIMAQAKEEGYREGYEEGYSEGFDKGYNEGKKKSDILINEAIEIKNNYINKKNSLLEELEEDIIELVISIYEKVINKRTKEDDELIVSLVLSGIKNLDLTDTLTIISSKEDYEMLEMAKQEILAKSSFISELEIKFDTSLEKGDCILETSKGNIDVSLRNQLDEVKELLTSILNNE